MDFEEFRLQLMDDIKSDLEDRTGENYSVEKTNVNKLQNAGDEGIVIKPEGAERIIEKGFCKPARVQRR